MIALSRPSLLRQKLELPAYLRELAILTNRPVGAGELVSVERTLALRHRAKELATKPLVSIDIPFSDKNAPRFESYLRSLSEKNRSPMYVWTPRTEHCGTLKLVSLKEIAAFPFSVNGEGVISVVTEDAQDGLTLDFSQRRGGEQWLTIEVQGVNWPAVTY